MAKFLKIITIFVACMVLLSVGLVITSTFSEQAWLRDRHRGRLASVNATDGIDAIEANVLAEEYFGAFVSACGGPDDIALVNGVWTSQFRVGYAGKLTNQFVWIEPRSGAIWSTRGPHFANFTAFRRFLFYQQAWWRLPDRIVDYMAS